MDDTGRAALLGLGVGFAHTVVRLFAVDAGTSVPPDGVVSIAVQSLVATGLLLAVVPGAALYGAAQFGAPVEDAVRLAAAVAVGTGVAVVASYPVLSPASQGVAVSDAFRLRLFVAFAVNAVGPAVHSGVGALAGFLLAAVDR
ncbi:hypothetical protein [Halobacterium yunchengense]|uniref:hypothetical protein n=1 Tax=Halobacterium yunchengense TaxID=3108497 RepID=UPI003008047F